MRRVLLAIATVALLGNGPAAADNRRIVEDFARMFYVERDVRQAFETYVAPDYIQHNPGVPDGREVAIALLQPMFSDRNRSFEVRKILVDGDLAAIHIFARPDPAARGAAVADFYRLKDGKIVEHWDVIQPIPEKSANAHPMF
ncbi:nuclear transport factor 2 family protein [Novosphingobium sp. ES2-1]|uniref:nuclear transport factor 2 family protein n=1 Tax=Novosphingobium sp. ES2-1 TaxID=2780074 RepID=UPI00187E579B|nr:nuclear transport factor 2 family protein [Novosphingobium sp. ES2-1]QOV93640.1 nuclear transport factor 2 family protein [Novosphingobium sp. ES2-1]